MRRNPILKSILCTLLLSASTATLAATGVDSNSTVQSINVNKVTVKANQGDKYAQYQLGLAYNSGTSVAQDNQQAIHWYEKAAEQGSIMAQYDLALMFEHGQGTTADYQKAAALYLQAAKQGHVGAQYSVGILYMTGKGLEKDAVKAWTWLALASDNGFENVDIVRDSLTGDMSDFDQKQASDALVALKSRIPEPFRGSMMQVALVGK